MDGDRLIAAVMILATVGYAAFHLGGVVEATVIGMPQAALERLPHTFQAIGPIDENDLEPVDKAADRQNEIPRTAYSSMPMYSGSATPTTADSQTPGYPMPMYSRNPGYSMPTTVDSQWYDNRWGR